MRSSRWWSISNGDAIRRFTRAHSDAKKSRNTTCQWRFARTESLAGRTVRSATPITESTTGASLDGEGLGLSAIKSSEDGAWLVLRCVNLTERSATGRWTLGAPITEARASRLDETPGEIVLLQGNSIAFTATPRAIVTLLVR